eukprot:UN07790
MNNQEGTIRLLFNKEAYDKFGPGMKFYHRVKGFVVEHENLSALAKYLDADEKAIRDELSYYNTQGNQHMPDKFGKTVYPVIFDLGEKPENPEFYTAVVTPVIHYTMGGLKINTP